MKQTDIILTHLMSGKSITSKEAMTEYGIARLASRIWDLKHMGYPIHDKFVSVPTRYGMNTGIKEYFIPDELRKEKA